MRRRTWQGDSPYTMLDRRLKAMGRTMLIGAILDVVLAFTALVFPSQLARLMGFDAMDELGRFWPLVHLVFPCFYILAWMDTKRNVAIVAGAIIARIVYALYMFAAVLFWRAWWVWSIAGGTSLVLAIAHYVFLRLSDFGLWEVFSRAGNPPAMKKSQK